MPKVSYLEIFKDALKLAWGNKYLWWFGFFIALSEVLLSFEYSFEEEDYDPIKYQSLLDAYSLTSSAFILISLAVFSVITFILLAIDAFGRGALIHSLNETSENRPANFKLGSQAGRKNFWKILSISILIGTFNLLSLIILFAPVVFLFFTKSYIIGTLLGIIAAIIIIPLFFITAFLKIFGYLYVVAGKTSVWGSLENSYNLLLKNLKATFTILLLLLVLNMILLFSFLIILIPFVVIFLLIGGILFLFLEKIGIIITASVAGLLFFALILAIKSIYNVFIQTIWLLFFRSIAKPEAPEKIGEPAMEPKKIPEPNPIENI